MDYWPHVAGKYTSNFTHHSITNLKVLTIFYDCCVCGLSCNCSLNCDTAIRRNASALILETMCYFNRKILRTTRLRYMHIDLGIGIVLIFFVSLSYVLTFMDYWPHVARKYTSFLNIVSV